MFIQKLLMILKLKKEIVMIKILMINLNYAVYNVDNKIVNLKVVNDLLSGIRKNCRYRQA